MLNHLKSLTSLIKVTAKRFWRNLSKWEVILDTPPIVGQRSILELIKNDDPTNFLENLTFKLSGQGKNEQETILGLYFTLNKYKAYKCFASLDFAQITTKPKVSLELEIYKTSLLEGVLNLTPEETLKLLTLRNSKELFFPSQTEGFIAYCVNEHEGKMKVSIFNYPRRDGFTSTESRRIDEIHGVLLKKVLSDLSPEIKIHSKWWSILSLPFDKVAEILTQYLQKTKDFKGFVRYSNNIAKNHPFKSAEIFTKLYTELLTKYPHSILLKEIVNKELIPIWGPDLSEEKLSATSWGQLYPHIKNRSLTKEILPKLYYEKELNYRFGDFPSFKRKFYYEGLWEIINEALKNPKVEAQWFLKLNIKSHIDDFHIHRNSSEFIQILNLLSSRSEKMLKSIVEEFCEEPNSYMLSDTLHTINSYSVEKPEDFAPNVESIKNYHDELHEVYVDNSTAELNQLAILDLDQKVITVPETQEQFKIVVPKIAKELGKVGRFLNICVGNGLYKDKILKKESYIFFLQKDEVVTHCVEIYDLILDPLKYKQKKNGDLYDFSQSSSDLFFMMIQGKGVKNQEMSQSIKMALKNQFKINFKKKN